MEYAKRNFPPALLNAIDSRDTLIKAVRDHKNASFEKMNNTIRKSRKVLNPAAQMALQF